jgi:hypothetical protein
VLLNPDNPYDADEWAALELGARSLRIVRQKWFFKDINSPVSRFTPSALYQPSLDRINKILGDRGPLPPRPPVAFSSLRRQRGGR